MPHQDRKLSHCVSNGHLLNAPKWDATMRGRCSSIGFLDDMNTLQEPGVQVTRIKTHPIKKYM
jgi:hypothetical protein